MRRIRRSWHDPGRTEDAASKAAADRAGETAQVRAGAAVRRLVDEGLSISDAAVLLDLSRSAVRRLSPATLSQFLREFTHGHVGQLASVARAHLVNLA